MTDQKLTVNMAEAWRRRAQEAYDFLAAAESAPALFDPEWVAKRRADLNRAARQATFWQGQR